MKRSESKKKKVVAKPVKKKAVKTKINHKTVKKADKFFVNKKDIFEVEDMFDFDSNVEKNVFAPDFLNAKEYNLDEILSQAEIIGEKVFKNDTVKKEIVYTADKEKSYLEKMIMEDVGASETLRMNNNYNLKLKQENVELNKNKFVPLKSRYVVNLKKNNKDNSSDEYIEREILFEIPKKPTLKDASYLYVKQVMHIASKSKTFKFFNFIGEHTIGFFSYIFLGIFFVFKSIFSLFAEIILTINSIGKGILRFFVVSSKKNIKEELQENGEKVKAVKRKIFSINPKLLFAKGAYSNYKSTFGFILFSALIIAVIHFLPILNNLNVTKGKVLGISEQAYQNFGNGIDSMMSSDFTGASNNFTQANSNFTKAQNEISQYNSVFIEMLKLVPEQGKKLDYGLKLISAGSAFSSAANHISEALSENNDLSLTDKIKLVSDNLKQTKDEIKIASKNISEIDPKFLPEEYRDQFSVIKDKLPTLSNNLDNLTDLMDVSLQLLADNSMKRYLFVFQNNNELRPTGGFMGSIAIVDIKEGKIANIKIPGGGPYDYKAGFYENIISPKPLWLINPNLNFWDSMWWSDFPTSANMMLKYFYKSGGPTVDGVIAVNAEVMRNLLSITGPIYLEKYNTAIDQNNFYETLQKEVEINYDREKNQPKAIIGDLADIVLTRIFEDKTIKSLDVLNVFENSTINKDIQMYFTDSYLEDKIKSFGWSGQMIKTDKDYLSVINTNIGGGKTDEFVKQTINHSVNILANGKIIDKVEITREYTPKENNIFSSAKNRDYIRIYVPNNSRLLEASGFENFPESEYVSPVKGSKEDTDFTEIDGRLLVDEASNARVSNSFDKTVFSGWQELNPGQTKSIVVSYELPFTLSFENNKNFLSQLFFKDNNSKNLNSYSIYYQKQSGVNSMLNTNYTFSNSLKTAWSSFAKMQNIYNFDKDFVGGFILKDNN